MLNGICNKCARVVAPHSSICGDCVGALPGEELLKHLTAEAKASVGMHLPIVFDPAMAMTIIGMLQLALRHPRTKGQTTSAITEDFIRGLQGMLAELHLAAHVEVISRGANAVPDVIDSTATPAET